jgi:hypothetical protein
MSAAADQFAMYALIKVLSRKSAQAAAATVLRSNRDLALGCIRRSLGHGTQCDLLKKEMIEKEYDLITNRLLRASKLQNDKRRATR